MFKLHTVGSDPEFFVTKNGDSFPAVRFTSGTKKEPEVIKPGFSLQRDNLMIEGNIPPSRTKDEFIGNISFLKDYIRSRIEVQGAELLCADSVKFKPRYLRIPEASEFGCDPYRLAWRSGQTAQPDDLSRISERVAGFHIHLGYEWSDVPRLRGQIAVAKAFDLFVTSPSRQIHMDKVRTMYYGRFGSFREKPYGVECRSLGGHFLQDKHLSWVWDRIQAMADYLSSLTAGEHFTQALLNDTFTKDYLEVHEVNRTGLLP